MNTPAWMPNCGQTGMQHSHSTSEAPRAGARGTLAKASGIHAFQKE